LLKVQSLMLLITICIQDQMDITLILTTKISEVILSELLHNSAKKINKVPNSMLLTMICIQDQTDITLIMTILVDKRSILLIKLPVQD